MVHILRTSLRQGQVAVTPTAQGGPPDDRGAVPHLWLSNRLFVVTADWEPQERDEGEWVSDLPAVPSSAWRAD